MPTTKRLSKKAKKFRSNVILSRNIILVMAVSTLIFISFLFLSSNITKIHVQTGNVDFIDANVSFHTNNNDIVNITITKEQTLMLNWYIESVELYLSSVEEYTTKAVMMNHIIYNQPIASIFNLNTLKYEMYKKTDNNTGKWDICYIERTVNCPNEFVLSYLKVTLHITYNGTENNVVYYYFFQNDHNITTKMNVVTYIFIEGLIFNATYYDEWYNWNNKLTDSIPNGYPYTITLNIMNYIIIQNPIDNDIYWQFGW